jgi:hypothetical protein
MVLIFIEAREMLNALDCPLLASKEYFDKAARSLTLHREVFRILKIASDLLSELHWPKMMHCKILALPLDKSTSTDQILQNESH